MMLIYAIGRSTWNESNGGLHDRKYGNIRYEGHSPWKTYAVTAKARLLSGDQLAHLMVKGPEGEPLLVPSCLGLANPTGAQGVRRTAQFQSRHGDRERLT